MALGDGVTTRIPTDVLNVTSTGNAETALSLLQSGSQNWRRVHPPEHPFSYRHVLLGIARVACQSLVGYSPGEHRIEGGGGESRSRVPCGSSGGSWPKACAHFRTGFVHCRGRLLIRISCRFKRLRNFRSKEAVREKE